MKDYYRKGLSGCRLQRVYALADAPVRAYLQGEIDHVRRAIRPGDRLLELGCGYGRIVRELAGDSHFITGIDNAPENIDLARDYLKDAPNTDIQLMDVMSLAFEDAVFDVVLCLQNGLSAFGLDPLEVIGEAWRVTKPDGRLLCFGYSDGFWPARLAWFRRQADAGLLGTVDESKTGDGRIVCTDGFVSSRTTEDDFRRYAARLGLAVEVRELATGSLFAEFHRPAI